jgi:peptidoglycan/LPS O-acetylase OafA/YrhL
MTGPSPRPAKIPELTGIRGIAACWVLSFHIWLVAGSPAIGAWGIDLTPFLACGWAGVDLFFVLSGFVLTWPQVDRDPADFRYVEFMRRRVLRVIPAYYGQFLLLMLLAVVGLISELPTFGNAVAHLLFLHNLNFSWSSPLPNTWWTLPIEWQFYLVFPLLLAALARFGAWRVLPGLIVIVLAWRIGALNWIQDHNPAAPIDYRVWLIEQLPGRIDQFFIGMAAAWITSGLWPRLGERARTRLSSALLVAGLVLTTLLIYVLWPRAQAYWQGHWLLYVWHLLVALPLAALIAGAALHGRPARALLGNRPALWLGEISYSIYLWNYVVLLVLVRLGAFAALEGPARIAWVALYSVVPVLLVSAVSWWLAERPFLHYRDPRPDDTVGRHLATFIRSPWRGLVVAALLILAVLAAAHWYWQPRGEARVQCTERGAIDSAREIEASDWARIVGWAHDGDRSDRIRRIVAIADGKVVGEAIPTVARPDVAAALPLCRVSRPGFELGVEAAALQMSATTLTLEAERSSGRRYRIGEVSWRFGPPKVSLDSSGPVTGDGEAQLLGWAWHPSGPVEIRWRQGKQLLARGTADGLREDVALAFPRWRGADRSGFSFRLKPADLPRGVGESVIEFIAPDGQRSEIPGPPIENDHPIGLVTPDGSGRLVDPEQIPLTVWVFDEHDIASITVATELGVPLGTLRRTATGVPLPGLFTDPRGIPPGDFWNRALRRGTLFTGMVPGKTVPPGIQRLVVHARDRRGREAVLPGPLVSMKLPPLPSACPGEPFRVYLWATTKMLRSGLPALAELRRMSEGGCVRFGLHARVEYLRTTRGKAADFVFDPDFPDARRFHQGKEMTTTSLREALAMADRYRVPMRILLDGGVWADSHFSIPEYDITDWLEEDERNVQWNQFGKTERDDALRGLAGGHDDPQLGRVLTLNIHNETYRHYKKRNLQAAVGVIVAYNQRHPDRPVSVTFDPDLYINPWFYLKQWYDYNPDTLRQFREWLTHTGPYAAGGPLAGLGYREVMSLEAINRVAKAAWSRLEDVDPPRGKPDYANPWHQIWTAYKRHLVGRHYADLAQWATEAGLEPDRIYTAQTFIQTDVSVDGRDTATGWVDEAGVSIAGAKPASGHLGAILYGPASRNQGKPRSGSSLLANVRDTDPHWEVAEMNPADIERPDRLPDHGESYRTLSTIFNFGAGAMSPMWNGVAGDRSVRPGQFKSYETLGQSPFETQLVLFLREVAGVPPGNQVWPFGNAYVASDDGFVPLAGSRITPLPGQLQIDPDTAGASSSIGIRRPLAGWVAPQGACVTLAAAATLPAGSLRLVGSDGKDLERSWAAAPDGRIEIDAGTVAGRRLDRIELRFAAAAIRLDRLGIEPCHR